jgi:hypothetical protein
MENSKCKFDEIVKSQKYSLSLDGSKFQYSTGQR